MQSIEQKAVLDRIEDATWAVLLIGETEIERIIPAEQLPEGAAEGTWLRLRIENDAIIEIVVDAEETGAARSRIRSKMDALRQRKRHFQPLTSEDESEDEEVRQDTPDEDDAAADQPDRE